MPVPSGIKAAWPGPVSVARYRRGRRRYVEPELVPSKRDGMHQAGRQLVGGYLQVPSLLSGASIQIDEVRIGCAEIC
jgi:hypothetical protein